MYGLPCRSDPEPVHHYTMHIGDLQFFSDPDFMVIEAQLDGSHTGVRVEAEFLNRQVDIFGGGASMVDRGPANTAVHCGNHLH